MSLDTSGLRAAYETFRAEGQAGGFGPPPPGEWRAEQVLAHIATGDEMFCEVMAALQAGQRPSFDNARAIDGDVLDAYVARTGDLAALADAVRVSGARMCDTVEALTDEQLATVVPVHIVDGATVAVDQPMPWSGLMGAQEHYHLPAHTEQLRALRR